MIVVSYFVHYEIFLQNVTTILLYSATYFSIKTSAFLLQNQTVLLQNASVIREYDVY